MMIHKAIFYSLPLCTLLIGNAAASITLVNLTFDTLPSAQGFTYSQMGPHAAHSESSQFAVSGGVLTQSTFGKGQAVNTPGNATYTMNFDNVATSGAVNFRLEFRANVTAHEQTRQDLSYAAFTQNVYINEKGFFMGIKPGEIAINGVYFTPLGFDGSVFHDYRIDVDLVGGTYEFFLDGAFVRTGSTVTFANLNLVTFGDGTGTANADGGRSKFTLTMNVPEPSSVLLLGLTGLVFSLLRSRR